MPAAMLCGANRPRSAIASSLASTRACIASISAEHGPAWLADTDAANTATPHTHRKTIIVALLAGIAAAFGGPAQQSAPAVALPYCPSWDFIISSIFSLTWERLKDADCCI